MIFFVSNGFCTNFYKLERRRLVVGDILHRGLYPKGAVLCPLTVGGRSE